MDQLHRNLIGQDSHPSRGVSKTFLNVNQNDEVIVPHQVDPNGSRSVQLFSGIASAGSVLDNSLDFDLIDESQFIQEDAVDGTDFLNGMVKLHDSGGGVPSTIDPVRIGSGVTLSNGDKTATGIGNSGASTSMALSSGVTSGKYYWEVSVDVDDGSTIGVYTDASLIGTNGAPSTFMGSSPKSIGWYAFYSGAYLSPVSSMTTISNVDMGGGYTTGDVVGVFLDCDNHTIQFSKNGVMQGPTYPIDAGLTYYPGQSSGSGNCTHTVRYDPNDLQYSSPGFTRGFFNGSIIFPLTPYYLTTSDQNNISLDDVPKINSLDITENRPANTDIKPLVSFDGRNTWKGVVDGSLSDVTGLGFDELTGNSFITDLQNALANYTINSETSLDFAFQLSSSDSSVTPSIDQITLDFQAMSDYLKINSADYEIIQDDASNTRLKKLSAGIESNLKANIIL